MRKLESLNANWTFSGPKGEETVSVPHSWNALDGYTGGNNYVRGKFTYRKTFQKPAFTQGEELVYVEFQGVNSSAKVSVNGTVVAEHDGGYSTFRAEITGLLKETNEIVVEADNSKTEEVYPQQADFTFYGGMYRDVNLIIVSKDHFDLDYYGGPGIKVTPTVSGSDGTVRVETFLSEGAQGEVEVVIRDQAGAEVARGKGTDVTLTIPKVHLWDGVKDPYLYQVEALLVRDGKTLDGVSAPCGVRSFSIDPQKGFILNGRVYPLRGVSRHQDRRGKGNAISRADHDEDMDLIREMGANTIRLAHYQHDQYFYDLCDRYGMVVWAEIPYISRHMPEARENTFHQMRELIVQNYNHPSIVVWGLSNEITIVNKHREDMLDNHYKLNDLCHEMDPTRPTTLACYAMCGPFNKVAHISDVVSWNLYLGWYVPGFFLNDWWISFFHMRYPNRALGYSEYGAEGMPNLHSSKPRRGDHTEEYQAIYHEFMLECFERHPYLWATHVWNMFDFAADARDQGGEPGMNHKGLVTFDRKVKKDSFYLYKAWWSDVPFVHLCSKRYVDRAESMTTVKVYSNQPKVALYVNGKLVEEQSGRHVFSFRVPLEGEVKVEAVAGDCRDEGTIRKVDAPNPAYQLQKGQSSSQNWV